MLSTTDSISSSWDSYHHCLQESLHGHDHPYYRHIPDNKNRQLKFGLDGKNPRKIMAKSDNEMVNLLRSKRPTTEDQVATSTSRVCADCRTSETPLWRSGPAGPKSLCNACGIRYRKRRRQFDFSQMGREMTVKEKQRQTEEDKNLVLVLKGRKSAGKEEAEAALLLMSLSCGLCVHS